MNAFMKILTLILCLCMVFAFASCDLISGNTDNNENTENENGNENNGDNIADKLEGITKEEWDAAISEEKFDNVTFGYSALFKGESKRDDGLYKLDGNRSSYVPNDGNEEEMDAETTEALRSVYVGTVLAIVENFESFTYDKEAGVFTCSADIVYTIDVMEYKNVKITASNTTVKLDANKLIAEISCDMKQEFVEYGENKTHELNVVFTFANYGTTKIGEEIPTTPAAPGDLANVYKASNAYKNVTLSVYAVEVNNDGTEEIDEQVMKTTETAMYSGDGERGYFYSIEDGKTYMYTLTESGWIRSNSYSSAPIGALVELYVGMFEDVFDSLTFDEKTNTHTGTNITINMYGREMKFDSLSIEVKDGVVYKFTYVMDIYDYSEDEPVVSGKGTATLTFTDYGKTVVELPTDYSDADSSGNIIKPGEGGNEVAEKPVSEEEWKLIFDKASITENVTVSMIGQTKMNSGSSSAINQTIEVNGNISRVTIVMDVGTDVSYYSMEEGTFYRYYYSTANENWEKVNDEYAPVGTLVMQQYTTPFASIYNDLTYDAENNAYVADKIVIDEDDMEFSVYDISIRFENGTLSEISYTSDAYSIDENGNMEVCGSATITLSFSNYGTTVVELPVVSNT